MSKIETLLDEIDVKELEVKLFTNAKDALDFVDDNSVKLIFSSIETDGVTFIITSQKSGENFEDMKDIGAKRFLQKPINLSSTKFKVPLHS